MALSSHKPRRRDWSDDDPPDTEDIVPADTAKERRSSDPTGITRWKMWLTFAVMAVAASCSGSREPWALGTVALLVGLNVALVPARVRPTRMFRILLVLLGIITLAGLLPLSPSSMPDWRVHASEDFGIQLSNRRSPQPWVTFETWMMIMLGIIWTWHCFSRGFIEAERRWLVRTSAIFIAVLASVAISLKKMGINVPFWRLDWELNYFGPFPNRNNFGGLLAMGAVLTFAAAYDAHRRKRLIWVLHALCIIPMFWAILLNTSRAGVILFFCALTAWMIFGSFSRRSARRLGISAAILLTLVAILLLFGKSILARFDVKGKTVIEAGGRVQIFSDCVDLISKVPVLGTGLGNFEPAFALTKSFSNHYSRNIHPESDWLWITAEAGIPAALILLLLLGFYVKRTGPWRENSDSSGGRKDRRLRNACALAALIIPFHGLVDTPAHQPGIVLGVILFAAASLRARRHVSQTSSGRKGPLVFAGLCFTAGFAWLAISAGIPAMPGESTSRMWERKAQQLDGRGDLAGAYAALDKAIINRPLHWNLYFKRATAGLPLGLPAQTVLEDFARARFLEPHSGLLCNQEGFLWLRWNPAYSLQAWREAIRRDPSRADDFYSAPLGALRDHPELRSGTRALATTPKLKLKYLSYATREEFDEVLRSLLDIQPELQSFSPQERLLLFRLWYAKGDRAKLLDTLDRNAGWRADGWPIIAGDRADKGDFAGACQLASDYLPPPVERTIARSGDLGQLQRAFSFNRTDASYGYDLYEAQKAKNLVDEALLTLDSIAELPGAGTRVFYEQATMLMRKGDYGKAWEKFRTLLEKS